MAEPTTVLSFENEQDQIVVRRLVTGLVRQWDRIPKHVQSDILRDAMLRQDSEQEIASLREQITAFIHKHGGDRP